MTDTTLNSTMSRAASVINLGLAIAIGVILAQALFSFLETQPVIKQGLSSSVDQSNTASAPNQNKNLGQKIASYHLFGNPAIKPKKTVEPVKQEEAPDTSLKIELLGVIAFDPIEHSMAILKSSGSSESVFAIGDEISRNAKLVEVYPDHIIIEHRGKREAVRLPKNVANNSPTSSPSPSANNINKTNNNRRPAVSSSIADLPTDPGALRARLIKEPKLLGKLAQIQPFKENGKIRGYTINPREGASVLSSLGLYAGDVVVSINGIELTNQRRGLNAMRRLVNAKEVNLVVLRGGAEVPLSVSLQ